MKLFDVFKKKEASFKEEVQKEVAAVERVVNPVFLDRPTKNFLKGFNFRVGMWVVTPAGTGIILGVDEQPQDTFVVVMQVDSKGENLIKASWKTGEVTQAQLKDIPESRRPDADKALSMGYK